jgi:hypothetical protein
VPIAVRRPGGSFPRGQRFDIEREHMLGRIGLLFLGFASLLWSGAASAVTITSSQSAGSVPGSAGTGSAAAYY